MTEGRPPCRIGVVIASGGKLNESALKFLVLAMNTEQALFQFEFYDFNPDVDPLLRMLSGGKTVVRVEAKREMPYFAERARANLDNRAELLKLSEGSPDRFVVVSQCRFDDNYYASRSGGASVLALGNWKRAMAPPSFVEFVQALLVREAVAALCPSLASSVHLGSKGCLLDFTERLGDARLKVLRGFVCHHCRSQMQHDGEVALADTVVHLLDREWLGQPSDPRTPAGVMASLHYDMFTTKGRQATIPEALLTSVRTEGVKQIVAVIGAVLAAVLLVLLGLNTGGR